MLLALLLAPAPAAAAAAAGALPRFLPAPTSLTLDLHPQAEVLGELEDRVVGYLQKGTDAEGEVLGSVAAVLPEPLKEALPEPLRDALRPRPAGGSASSAGGSSKPLATWTITSDNEEGMTEPEAPPMTPAAIAASQTGAGRPGQRAAVWGCGSAALLLCTTAQPRACRCRALCASHPAPL